MKKVVDFLLFLTGKRRKEKIPSDYKPSVSVLIPAYNEEATIGNTILSVQNQNYPLAEIIVVDDCSSDRTGEIAQSLGVKVVRTAKNTGTKSKAQNFGLQFVKTEVLVTVDADTVLDLRAIELVIPSLADGKTLSVCGFVIPQKTETFWERTRLVQYLYFIGLNKSAQSHWLTPLVSSGCFSVFNAKMLKEMGGFPEGTMVEDMALTWRAYLEGKRVKFVPQAACYPKDPSNWKQYRSQVTRWNRGFLQCVREYKFGLTKNLRLFLFVTWYLISGILSPFLWIIFAWYLGWFFFTQQYQGQLLFFLLSFGLFLDAVIVFITVSIGGIRWKCLKLAVMSFPYYWLVAPIDAYLFANAVIQEWFLGKKLQTWEKGH